MDPPNGVALPRVACSEAAPPLEVWPLPARDDLGVTAAFVGRTGTGKTHTAKAFVRALARVWAGRVGVFVLMAGGQAASEWRAFLGGSGEPDDVTMLPDALPALRWDGASKAYADDWVATVPAYGDARPRELVALEAWLAMHLSARRVLVAAYDNDAVAAPRAILVIDDVVNIIGTAFGQNLGNAPQLREALMRGRQYGMSTVVLSQQPQALAPMMRAINLIVPCDGTVFGSAFGDNLAARVPAPYALDAVLAATRVSTADMRRGRFVPVVGEGVVACMYVRPECGDVGALVAREAVATAPARGPAHSSRAAAAQAALRRARGRPRADDDAEVRAVRTDARTEVRAAGDGGGSLLSAAVSGARGARWRK